MSDLILTAIVKNEAHVLSRLIESVKPHISGWAIVDTGSTDGTQELLKELLGDLPGDVKEVVWTDDFGEMRTEALRFARKLFPDSYSLIMDADDMLVVDGELPELTAHGYNIKMDVPGDILGWERVAIYSNKHQWEYRGVRHEYPVCLGVDNCQIDNISNVKIQVVGGGGRSISMPQLNMKGLSDGAVMQNYLARNPDTPDKARYCFYIARSFTGAGHHHEAKVWYERAAQESKWDAEVYQSLVSIGNCVAWTSGNPTDDYLKAYAYAPHRAEALVYLGHWYKKSGKPGYDIFYREAAAKPIPVSTSLIDLSCYTPQIIERDRQAAEAAANNIQPRKVEGSK